MIFHPCPHTGSCEADLFPICHPPARWKNDRTAPRVCTACPDQLAPEAANLPPLTGPANLIWFVYPRQATREVWTAQQETIRAAINRFDGLKFCAIAIDDSTDDASIDRSSWDDVIELLNEPHAREVIGWRRGMERMKSEPGFTVWLHAKGVFRGVAEPHLQRWWELAYETLLQPNLLRRALERNLIAGVFRRNQWADNLGVPWHFSGSFYAVRNSAIRFPASAAGGWYAEAWPALIAPRELAACLRFDGCDDLYQARNWHDAAIR